MPAPLLDRRLASVATSLRKKLADAPLGRDQAIELLAQLADRPGRTATTLLKELMQAGLTPRQLIGLARAGLNRDEKADLEKLLTTHQLPLTTEARELLEGVLGNAVKAKSTLEVKASNSNLSAKTTGRASIEAVNLSSSARSTRDAFVVGTTNDAGSLSAALSGELRTRGGDVVRTRARFDDGTATDWVTVKASGADERNAELQVTRLELRLSRGRLSLRTKEDEVVSEPNATLALKNLRTQQVTTVTLDDDGRLPTPFSLGNGRASDRFSVAISDGTHNTTFSETSGFITVPGEREGQLVPTPVMHKDDLNTDGTPKMELRTYPGPFVREGLSLSDIRQGRLANCYFPAAVGSVLHAHPRLLEKLMKDNGDGTFTFTFTKRDWNTGKTKKEQVTVDADLWTRPDRDTAYYGRGDVIDRKSMELWYPLLEKAHAVWKGGYQVVGEGGVVCDVMEELTGEAADYVKLHARSNADTVWNRIVSGVDADRPMAAGTHGPKGPVHYTNTGVLADHAYTIIGYQTEGSKRYVVLRNPWGDTEPKGHGEDDGVFKLELSRFMHLMADLHSTTPD